MLVRYWRTNLSDYKDYEKAVHDFDEKKQLIIKNKQKKIQEFREKRFLPVCVQINYMHENSVDVINEIKRYYHDSTIPNILYTITNEEYYYATTGCISSFLPSSMPFKFISQHANKFDHDIVYFSSDLSYMSINCHCEEFEKKIKLPKCLKKLEFSSDLKFLENIDFSINEMLFEIEFGPYFNESLKNIELPNSLRKIYFGDNFNTSLEEVKFPDSLVSIVFGRDYNKSLKNIVFPKFLERINFGLKFNQPLTDCDLPDSITELVFGYEFNQPLQNIKFPNSLKSISFGENYSQYLTDVEITPNLKTFIFKTKNIINMLNTIPPGITKIHFIDPKFNGTTKITNLPMTIKKIFLKNDNVIQNFQKIPLNCKIIVTPTTLKCY